MLSEVLLMIGLFWGAIGIVFWIPIVSKVGFLSPMSVQNLIFFVIAPALFFVFASIILSITNVHSNI